MAPAERCKRFAGRGLESPLGATLRYNPRPMRREVEPYRPHDFEQRWQDFWQREELDKTPEPPREKRYLMEMFAYPSGDIHMGHFRNYTIGDVVARFERMRGKDVLHPFGWDAFGLPAENAAIKHGIHPAQWTYKNIETSRNTLRRMGISYDWDREVVTCRADYYKFTQWMFPRLIAAPSAGCPKASQPNG